MLHSNRQLKILNYLYPKEKVSESDFKSKFGLSFSNSVIKELIKDKLINIDSRELYHPKIELTEQGHAYVEDILSKEAERNFDHACSIASIIISVISLIVSIVAILT